MDLDKLVQGIKIEDRTTFSKLKILFAPTGSFQELSITNDGVRSLSNFQ